MSTRDNQKKYDDKSNVDSSIYSRVNIGQGASNKFDGPNLTHSGGSMNNPDEQAHYRNGSLATAIYYVIGIVISAAIIFAGMQIFHDYFYGEGLNKVFPSLLLLFGSLAIGFVCANLIIKKFVHFKKR